LAIRGCALGAGLLAVVATSPAGAPPPRLTDAILAAAGGKPSAAAAALAKGVAVNGIDKWVVAAVFLVGAAVVGVAFGGGTRAAATGLAWIQPSFGDRRLPDGDLTFKLVPDQAVTGRVIDTQGKPVVGAAVGVIDVIAPLHDDMDRLVASVKKGGFGLVGQWE